MLKKIPIKQLRLGMFIQELGGRWMDHPFWRSSFKLDKPEDFQALLQSGLPELVIDTGKGLDVESAPAPVAQAVPPAPKEIPPPVPRMSYEQEIEQAKQIQGKAKRVVTNLFNQARMGKAIEISVVAPLVDEINHSIERNAGALLSIVRLKTVDDYTYLHSVAVCALMISLGQRLGLKGEELRQVGMGGLLHDLGKMGVPLEILNKPGKLTDEEFTIIKSHPIQGWEILNSARMNDAIPLDVCLHHHEKMDGSGYPERLSGADITLHARMGAVCDVYDAVTSDRSYKRGWEPAEAIKRMAEFRNGHFDETVFQAFVKTIGIFPAGSLVRLQSGRLAVVTDQSEKSLLTPKVKVFFSIKSKGPIQMEVIDLSHSHDSIDGLEDVAAWGFDLKKVMGF
ncbi:MAG: HD-GYP domain-containing protein [Hydrogenophilales bacterium]|nr:HD-GYP domain-containing protein [Hydrogenophilales bacterium]